MQLSHISFASSSGVWGVPDVCGEPLPVFKPCQLSITIEQEIESDTLAYGISSRDLTSGP